MSYIPDFVYAFGYLDKRHKRAIIAAGTAAVGVVALMVSGLPSFSSGGPKVKDRWVVEQTLAETTAPAKVAPPFVKGSETRVVATFYTSGAEQKLWYLKKYNDAEKKALEDAVASSSPDRESMRQIEKKAMVRSPVEGSAWVPVDSDAGRKITALPTPANTQNQPSLATVGD